MLALTWTVVLSEKRKIIHSKHDRPMFAPLSADGIEGPKSWLVVCHSCRLAFHLNICRAVHLHAFRC